MSRVIFRSSYLYSHTHAYPYSDLSNFWSGLQSIGCRGLHKSSVQGLKVISCEKAFHKPASVQMLIEWNIYLTFWYVWVCSVCCCSYHVPGLTLTDSSYFLHLALEETRVLWVLPEIGQLLVFSRVALQVDLVPNPELFRGLRCRLRLVGIVYTPLE